MDTGIATASVGLGLFEATSAQTEATSAAPRVDSVCYRPARGALVLHIIGSSGHWACLVYHASLMVDSALVLS